MTEQQIEELLALLHEAGWIMAIPETDETITGLIIGTPEYVGTVTALLPENIFDLPKH